MDDVTRALAHGEAGLGKIEAGLGGNLGLSAEYAAIEDATAEPQYQFRPRPYGYARFRLIVVVFCVLVLGAMILIH